MKKISRIMTMLVLCLAFLVIPTACKAEIKSHKLKPGTLETTVVKGATVDTSKVVVYYTYSDDKVKEVGASDLTFSQVDTSVVTENAKLTITYEDYSFDITIRVRASADDINDIASFVSNSQNIYNDNVETNAIGFYNHSYNSQKDTEEGAEEKYLGIEPRYVGTDNPFIMDLSAAGYDANNQPVSGLEDVSTNIKVELIDNGTYTELNETSTPTLASMVTIDSNGGAKFQFTEEAEGKAFRVTVEPRNKKAGIPTVLKVVAELHVIEGFNVHDAQDLAVYDNSGRDYDMDGIADWNDIKTAVGEKYGIDNIVTYVPKAVILQNNINIEDRDVPSTMFWSKSDIRFEHDNDDEERYLSAFYDTASSKVGGVDERGKQIKLEGSMVDRDWTGVYHYNFTQEGGEINMIGNYFTISCKDLSRAVVQTTGASTEPNRSVNTTEGSESYMEMHSTLFCHTYMFEDDDPASVTDRKYTMNNDCNISWKNINFTGNGAVSDAPQYSGSIILFKSYRVNTDIYNCVSTNFAINYLMSSGETDCDKDGEFRIDYCKGTDSYQALIFAHGCEHLLVTNSSFERACGPAIIAVLVGSGDYDEYKGGGHPELEHEFHIANIDIVNSKIESVVSGSEPWFKIYNADSQIVKLTQAEGLLDGSAIKVSESATLKDMHINTGKTIYDPNSNDNQFNLQVLYMKSNFDFGSKETVSAEGKVRFFDGDNAYADYVAYKANSDANYDLGIVMDGTVANVAKEKNQIIVDGDNGCWFSAGFNGTTDVTASTAFLTAMGAMTQYNNFDYFKNMLSDTNYLDFYLPTFGMACRCQLYSRGA